MDERSIDKAPSASLDMMALNKTVVNARSIVRKAKTHLINKLVRNVTDLKKKKGSEQQKEKNLKKAQRFLEEIDSMRTLKDDKIFKYALANVSKFEEIAKSTVSPAARAMARLADHRLIQGYVQKFRDEQSDWRDLAAFMLMKQTGRKFKNPKQKDKVKGKKERKKVEIVNKAENVRASKLMTEVYTQGLFREDDFQKTKETVESDSKGELNFLQKRRLRIANEKKEKQKLKEQKLNSSLDNKPESSLKNVGSSNVKGDISDGDSGEENKDGHDMDDESSDSERDESEEESKESGEEVLENSEITKSEEDDSDDDDLEKGEGDEEEMEVSDDSSENDDSEGELYDKKDRQGKNAKKIQEALKVMKSNDKDEVGPLKSKKNNNETDKVELLKSKLNSEKDKVKPLNLMNASKRNKECVVKQLNIGSLSDDSESEEEGSDEGEEESSDEEEKTKQSKRGKKSKPVPKFLTEAEPNSKKLPKDSFFEGGDFDSESENSEKDSSEDDDKDSNDDSEGMLGNRGKIKSLIYNSSRGGFGAGRGRGRGQGSNNESKYKFGGKDKAGKTGKKPFGRGGGDGNGPFSFGSKEVVYKRRNQTLITEEGKTKLSPETKESKPKLHPSWEASRKRKSEESGGIKAFAGKRISFGDD